MNLPYDIIERIILEYFVWFVVKKSYLLLITLT